jgi:hypothetical protein
MTTRTGLFYPYLSEQDLNAWYSEPLACSVLPNLKVKAGQYGQVYHMDLKQALRTLFKTDAQMQPAHASQLIKSDGQTWRLSVDQLKDVQVQIDFIALDFDAKQMDNPREKWAWSNDDFTACVVSWSSHPILGNSLTYKTKHGLRCIIPLEAPFILDKDLKGKDWEKVYEQILAMLPKSTYGAFDVSCDTVVKTYRLPQVVREKEPLQSFFYVPNKQYVHKFDRLSLFSDISYITAQRQSIRGVNNGLIEVFKASNLYLEPMNKQINGQMVHRVQCPWHTLHSSTDDKSTASVLFLGDNGWVFNCMHASCKAERTKPNALRSRFPREWGDFVQDGFEFEYDSTDGQGIIKNLVEILKSAKEAPFYQRGHDIVRVKMNAEIDQEVMYIPSVEEITGYILQFSRFYTVKVNKEGMTRNYIALQTNTIKTYYAYIKDELPRIEGITSLPPINNAFEPLQAHKGFCEAQACFYAPVKHFNASSLLNIPSSIKEAKASALRLLDLFCDFPFAQESYRLMALATLFTAGFRKKIDAPAPLFLVSANSKATGKTTFIQTALAGVYGIKHPSIIIPPEKTEELEKRLDGLLLSGEDYIVIDNITNSLGTGGLDAMLTSTVYKTRRLGSSEMTSVKIKTFFAGTANNAVLKADTDRRVITVRLVSDLDNPAERSDFKHKDIVSYASQHTSSIWRDMLTIQKSYQEHADLDALSIELSSMGSFTEWADWVQYPVAWVGKLLGFEKIDIVEMSRSEIVSRENDDLSSLFQGFYTYQREMGIGHLWNSQDLLNALKTKKPDDSHLEIIQETLLQGLALNAVNLGRRLMRYKDKVCNGYKLQFHRLKDNKSAFSLVKVSPPRKETLPTDFTQYPTPKVEAQAPIQQAQVPIQQAHVKALESVQVNPLQAILEACGYKEDTDKKQACNFLQAGNNCGLSSGRCEAEFIYQIQEPVKQEPVKQEPVEEETQLFNVPSIDPLTRVFTEQLKLRLSTLLKELKKPAEIVDILIKENFPVDKNKWTSIKVNKAIEFFGLSKEKKSGAELKLEKRGVYDHRWLQGFPTTRVSKEVYLSQYAEGVPMGGVTCDANSTKKSIKFDASDLIKSVLGVSSIKEALAKATTPEQREQASKEKYGDKE